MFNYIDFKNSSDIDGTLISEVKQSKDGGVSLKLQDKMKALQWLGEHVDILDTATKQKLELEKQKLNYEKSKKGSNSDGKGNIGELLNALHKSGDKQ